MIIGRRKPVKANLKNRVASLLDMPLATVTVNSNINSCAVVNDL